MALTNRYAANILVIVDSSQQKSSLKEHCCTKSKLLGYSSLRMHTAVFALQND